MTRRRGWAAAGTLGLIAGLGALFASLPPLYHLPREAPPLAAPAPAPADPRREPAAHVAEQRARELRRTFDQAVVMLHARQYEYAIAALHRVLALSPRLPEAHVNMGYALLGLERYGAARDFFLSASALDPRQANAYYGLAEAQAGLGELPEALGAMRTYLHLAPPDAPFVTRARAAIWAWESRLGHDATGAATRPAAAGRDAAHPPAAGGATR